MKPSTSDAVRRTPPQRTSKHRKYSSRAFFLTLLIVSCIAAVTLFGETRGSRATILDRRSQLQSRGLSTLSNDDENKECRLVHRVPDQHKCEFVQSNCPDEEAGLFSYLTLYYCRMPHARLSAFILMTLWLGLLFSTIGIAASDFFCVNLSTISNLLGMSESLAGVTFLAFGNGSPDVFSTYAAMSTNSGSLAIGELIGAAGFITAVVAGSMAIVRPFKVAKKSFIRDVGFFIIAASFSMVFLYDGKLHFWECMTMVGFYIFYVVFVVIWHWWIARKQKKRQRESLMRAHFVNPGGEEADVDDHHDDDEGETRTRSTTRVADDFAALERGGDYFGAEIDEDEEEVIRERLMGELSNNMRLSRPQIGERRTTTRGQIRPSLVGALEFRAVLSALKKSRSIQMPMLIRRYSDDPNLAMPQQDAISIVSDPAEERYYNAGRTGVPDAYGRVARAGIRIRAVSVNDADALDAVHPSSFQDHEPPHESNLLAPPSTGMNGTSLLPPASTTQRESGRSRSTTRSSSPSVFVSPPPSNQSSRASSANPPGNRQRYQDLLAPPEPNLPVRQPTRSADESPRIDQRSSPNAHKYPKLDIPDHGRPRGSSPPAPFPSYEDHLHPPRASSLHLPPPSVSPDSYSLRETYLSDIENKKPLKWWPYKYLPPPTVIVSTLFPTLNNWRDKNTWEKLLCITAAPSVFLLTITLPVVEGEKEEDEPDGVPTLTIPSPISAATPGARSRRSSGMILDFERTKSHSSELEPYLDDPSRNPLLTLSPVGYGAVSGAHSSESRPPNILQSPEQLPVNLAANTETQEWNRWLVILQCFVSPFFMVLVLWANMSPDKPSSLIKVSMISLVISLCLLLLILLTTSPTKAPRYRNLLCFAGFIVSIAWISTIANEVVGVLKTIGVVLDISDAILGLTIFAVGNSLGDLVADITVARLGFPIMALSACFGGPMMNILLGIGLSGGAIAFQGAHKHQKKHPGENLHFKVYHIHVSRTLVISGASLLVTLLLLLIIVPMRRWRMDRFIGFGIVALWFVSTIGNVVIDVCGWGAGSLW